MFAQARWYLPVLIVILAAAPTWAEEGGGFLGIQLKKNENANGLFVSDVIKDSAAEMAKIQTGDIITKLDGKEVNELPAFVMSIRERKVGDKITLTIERSGKEMEIKVTLGKPPKDNA